MSSMPSSLHSVDSTRPFFSSATKADLENSAEIMESGTDPFSFSRSNRAC